MFAEKKKSQIILFSVKSSFIMAKWSIIFSIIVYIAIMYLGENVFSKFFFYKMAEKVD